MRIDLALAFTPLPYNQLMRQSMSTSRDVLQLRGDEARTQPDHLAVEEPLEIRINDQPLAITMRTPGHDRDLAAGFCLTEGVVTSGTEIESVEPCAIAGYGNVVVVRVSEAAEQRRAAEIGRATRENYLSSSCGLCGKQSLDRVAQQVSPMEDEFEVSPTLIEQLPERMRVAQDTFEATGGLHAACLFTHEGDLLCLREDVGRHNAVDKVIGDQVLLDRVPLQRTILLVSGRASFEIMQKAAMARIAMVCAVSAPSSLAVDFARQFHMTLVGFLRPGRMNIYHDANRIRLS